MMLWGDVVCDVVWGGMIDLKLFGGFGNGQTDRQTDICGCRVAFATENSIHHKLSTKSKNKTN